MNTVPCVPNVPLILVRETLDNLPDVSLPPDLILRPFYDGDETLWLDLIRAAETFEAIPDRAFQRAYGFDPDGTRQRVYFLVENGRVIGTVGAWYGLDEWMGWGRIHWLYLLPDVQGRGLGKILLSFALHRLKELGHTKAYLKTSSGRLPALRLYERFGFR